MKQEHIVTRDELIGLFMDDKIVDTSNGWVYEDWIVEIIALHTIDTKYLENLTNSKLYKIKQLRQNKNYKN